MMQVRGSSPGPATCLGPEVFFDFALLVEAESHSHVLGFALKKEEIQVLISADHPPDSAPLAQAESHSYVLGFAPEKEEIPLVSGIDQTPGCSPWPGGDPSDLGHPSPPRLPPPLPGIGHLATGGWQHGDREHSLSLSLSLSRRP